MKISIKTIYSIILMQKHINQIPNIILAIFSYFIAKKNEIWQKFVKNMIV